MARGKPQECKLDSICQLTLLILLSDSVLLAPLCGEDKGTRSSNIGKGEGILTRKHTMQGERDMEVKRKGRKECDLQGGGGGGGGGGTGR